MFVRVSCVLLLSTSLLAQAPSTQVSPKAANATSTTRSAADIPPNAAVITIKGLCPDQKPDAGTECKTVVTRSDFEQLAAFFGPKVRADSPLAFAEQITRTIILAHQARREGLESDPKLQERLQMMRVQTMADFLYLRLRDKAEAVSDEDVEKVYRADPAKFGEADLLRIYVPGRAVRGDEETDEQWQKEVAQTRERAEKFRQRALAGEDFEKLQAEALAAANYDKTSLPVRMSQVSQFKLPSDQQSVLELKPGEISQLFPTTAGFVMYKMASKKNVPFEAVREVIREKLKNERLVEAMNAATAWAQPEFDKDYFRKPTPQFDEHTIDSTTSNQPKTAGAATTPAIH